MPKLEYGNQDSNTTQTSVSEFAEGDRWVELDPISR